MKFASKLLILLLLIPLAACGDDDGSVDMGPADAGSDGATDAGVDEGVDTGVDEGVDLGPEDTGPEDTGVDLGTPCQGPPGLYDDFFCTELSAGIRPYEPNIWLWTDEADKERFISLPRDSQIDTSDPDNWIYPVGTRVWKNFIVDGVRVETRYFEKLDPEPGFESWSMRTFAWNEEQDAVEELTMGRDNVLGTNHDIPSRSQCIICHAQTGRADILASFTAIQLNHEDTDFALDELNDAGWLSDPVSVEDAVFPGDAVASEALGYLHANCGNCHGNERAPAGLRMWVNVGDGDVESTDTFTTAVNRPSLRIEGDATLRIAPGDSANSMTIVRMSSREIVLQMPPIGTEMVHPEGIEDVAEWIDSLPMDAGSMR